VRIDTNGFVADLGNFPGQATTDILIIFKHPTI